MPASQNTRAYATYKAQFSPYDCIHFCSTAPNVKISTAKKPVYAAYEAPEKTQALHLKEVLNAAPKVPVYAYDPAAMYEPYASGPISLLQVRACAREVCVDVS